MLHTPLKTALSLALIGAALPAAAADFRVGVVGGPTFQKLNVASETFPVAGSAVSTKTKRRLGFSAGVALEWGFGDLGTLRFEPRYVQKGTRIDVSVRPPTGPSQAFTSRLDTAYVDAPLMFRTEFFKKKPVRLYMMSGIGPNFLVSAKSDGDDVKSDFKSVEVGVVSALGLARYSNNVIVMADFRLSSSLTRIDKDPQPKAPKSRNTGLQATLSLIFPKKK